MVLTRVLRRPLPGGVEVVVSRSYEIRIHPGTEGYVVEGKLVGVETQVPAPYEALARLERERVDDGLFPMTLDRTGRLLPSLSETDPAPVHSAGSVALAKIDGLGLSHPESMQAKRFVRNLTENRALTAWPEDLFRPVPGTRSDTRPVALPDGGSGEVLVSIEARADKRDGLLESFRRIVTTRLGGSARVTQETWTLSRKS